MTTARSKRAAVIPVTAREATDFNELSWAFLNSEFAREPYAAMTIERRLGAFLRHQQLRDVLEDSAAYARLLNCVMANIGPAVRSGVLGVGASHARHSVPAARTELRSS
jgi:predicted glycosyl hydrolase (DUF1957 family)